MSYLNIQYLFSSQSTRYCYYCCCCWWWWWW